MSTGRMRPLQGVFIPHVTVNYSPRKAYTYTEQLMVDSKSVVNHLLIPHQVQQRSSKTLEWDVMTNTSRKVLLLSTQRSRLRRQWSGALVTALRSRGMNPDGSPLNPDSPGVAGTLELVVFDARGWGEPSEYFALNAGKVVDALLKDVASKPQVSNNKGHKAFNFRGKQNQSDKLEGNDEPWAPSFS